MKKFICLLIIFVFTGCAAQSVTLSGGVSYTVNEARQIAFDGVAQKIDMSKYKEYFVDKNYEKNQELLDRGKTRYRDREIIKFSDGYYGVCYKNNKNISFYYDKTGCLNSFSVVIIDDYPQKGAIYDKNGDLRTTFLNVSHTEQFVFNLDKKLISHWIGKNCYNEKGELVKTRR